ncbi:hypothetical protein BH20ACT23_BH20ACT23_19420 [soil metagenome]
MATADGLVEWPDGPRALNGTEVNALALAGETRYAIAGSSALRDDGEGWQEVARARGGRANCLIASKAGLFVGASEAHLLKEEGGNLVTLDAFESAPGRDDWFTPWGGPPDVRSLTEDESGALYCNVHVGGILRSDDGGEAWTPTIDIGSDVHEVAAASGAVIAATAWGFASSTDKGTSWEFDDGGLHATYARAVALADDTIVMSVSSGPRGDESILYRRHLDAPGSFERCGGDLPESFSTNINTGCVAAAGTMVAFGTEEGELYLSDDSAATFTRVADDLAPVRWVVLP